MKGSKYQGLLDSLNERLDKLDKLLEFDSDNKLNDKVVQLIHESVGNDSDKLLSKYQQFLNTMRKTAKEFWKLSGKVSRGSWFWDTDVSLQRSIHSQLDGTQLSVTSLLYIFQDYYTGGLPAYKKTYQWVLLQLETDRWCNVEGVASSNKRIYETRLQTMRDISFITELSKLEQCFDRYYLKEDTAKRLSAIIEELN